MGSKIMKSLLIFSLLGILIFGGFIPFLFFVILCGIMILIGGEKNENK
jgi:hypothetical protein